MLINERGLREKRVIARKNNPKAQTLNPKPPNPKPQNPKPLNPEP